MSQHLVIEKRSNSAASISIATALIGFVFSLIPLLGWFLAPVWILSILFDVVGLFRQYKRGFAIAGIAIGFFTFVYKIAFLHALFG